MQNIPTGYFEAKPQRVVGFNEVRMVIAPDNMGAELESALKELSIPYTTYTANDEADRLAKLNSLEDVQFSVRELSDGRKYVEVDTDQHIFENAEPSEYPKIARNYIRDHFRNTVIGERNKAYVRRESENEYTYPAKKSISSDVYSAKMRAATELNNLLDVAELIGVVPDDGRHPDAVRGWAKYRTVFTIDNRFFEGEISLKLIKRGDLFYDMTKIKDITEPMRAEYSYELQHPGQSNVSDTSISESSEFDNPSGKKFSLRDQTDTPEFQRWFGDSEVVDDEGNPLVVYHTTDSDFTTFDSSFLGSITDSNASDGYLAATAHVGFWFNTQDLTSRMSGKAMPVYLSSQRMYEVGTLDTLTSEIWDTYTDDYDTEDPSIESAADAGESYRRYLESRGYDGIMVTDTEFGGTSYVVFEPEQIKSATDNVGTFDSSNPDIRYSPRTETEADLTRQYLESMEVTDSMDANEKWLLEKYQRTQAGQLNIGELARVCGVSRPMVYQYMKVIG